MKICINGTTRDMTQAEIDEYTADMQAHQQDYTDSMQSEADQIADLRAQLAETQDALIELADLITAQEGA